MRIVNYTYPPSSFAPAWRRASVYFCACCSGCVGGLAGPPIICHRFPFISANCFCLSSSISLMVSRRQGVDTEVGSAAKTRSRTS